MPIINHSTYLTMPPEILTLKLLCGNMGYALGWCSMMRRSYLQRKPRAALGFMAGTDSGTISTCVRNLRDILRAHPQLKREAARWIKAGILAAK